MDRGLRRGVSRSSRRRGRRARRTDLRRRSPGLARQPVPALPLGLGSRLRPVVPLRYNELPRGANMAFRRASFADYGDFLEQLGRKGDSLRSCEEIEYCLRLERGGEAIVYLPSRRRASPCRHAAPDRLLDGRPLRGAGLLGGDPRLAPRRAARTRHRACGASPASTATRATMSWRSCLRARLPRLSPRSPLCPVLRRALPAAGRDPARPLRSALLKPDPPSDRGRSLERDVARPAVSPIERQRAHPGKEALGEAGPSRRCAGPPASTRGSRAWNEVAHHLRARVAHAQQAPAVALARRAAPEGHAGRRCASAARPPRAGRRSRARAPRPRPATSCPRGSAPSRTAPTPRPFGATPR